MASPQAEGYARRPVTRSLVKNGFIFIASSISDAPIQDKKSSFKKVKFVDLNSSAIHNSSVATDEGIDVSFTSSSANIPASICRPYHALSQNWIFWFSSGNKKASWNQNQISLASLETVEDFWILYNKVQPCSYLSVGQSYSIFRSGVMPDWEDPANRNGGRWMLCFDSGERAQLDKRWLEILFMVLSGRAGSIVTGAEVCVRKKVDRLELWLGVTTDLHQVTEVGRKLKALLGDRKAKIKFSIHGEEKAGLKRPCLMI